MSTEASSLLGKKSTRFAPTVASSSNVPLRTRISRPSRRATSASTIITRLKTFQIRSLVREEKEWQDTHVDIYHSCDNRDSRSESRRRRKTADDKNRNALVNDDYGEGDIESAPAYSSSSSSSSSSSYSASNSNLAENMQKLWTLLSTPTLILLIGIITAVITITINTCSKTFFYPFRVWLVEYGFSFRPQSPFASSTDSDSDSEGEKFLEHQYAYSPYNFLIYILVTCFLSVLSAILTYKISPSAIGGGIPEIKSMLSGACKTSLVTPRTIIAKSIGLILAFGAGLSVGKEGPLVHISVAVAETLMRQKPWLPTLHNSAKRLEILGCAAAAGVATTFGTPFAATIFSIEVTAGYFVVDNLSRAFVCAVIGTLSMQLLQGNTSSNFALFGDLPKMASGYTLKDLGGFIVLGILSGLLGCLFIKCITKIVKFRNEFLNPENSSIKISVRRRVLLVFLVTLLVSPLIYFDILYGVEKKGGDQQSMMNFMFDVPTLPGFSSVLLAYLPLKFLTTVLCVTLPLPVGLFTPVFLIGGTLGRVVGEFFKLADNYIGGDNYITGVTASKTLSLQPWEFALIGSASFSAGVTRAISTAVIILELSGEHHLRVPSAIAVIVAYFIGNCFTKNVYDALSDAIGFPIEPPPPPESVKYVSVDKVMATYDNGAPFPGGNALDNLHIPPTLSLDTTVRAAASIIGSGDNRTSVFDSSVVPIVESASSMILVGAARVSDVRKAIEAVAKTVKTSESSGDARVVGGKHGSGTNLSSLGKKKLHPLLEKRLSFVALNENGKMIRVVKEEDVGVAAEETVDLIHHTDFNIPIDVTPYCVLDNSPIIKVSLVFRMLKLNQAFVTHNSRLVGLVNRTILRKFAEENDEVEESVVGLLWDSLRGICVGGHDDRHDVCHDDNDNEDEDDNGQEDDAAEKEEGERAPEKDTRKTLSSDASLGFYDAVEK